MSQPRAYPLAWPAHRPRTPESRRRFGKFKIFGSERYARDITVAQAIDRLDKEIQRLGGRYALLSSNVETRLDGKPRSGRSDPADPGVCVYFSLSGNPYALACDTYTQVAQNIAALAAHIEATRAITRHGVATAEDTLQAFSALPPPGSGPVSTIVPPRQARAWREVLGLASNWPNGQPGDTAHFARAIRQRFRIMAVGLHPDMPGGSAAAFTELTAARDAALKEIGA